MNSAKSLSEIGATPGLALVASTTAKVRVIADRNSTNGKPGYSFGPVLV